NQGEPEMMVLERKALEPTAQRLNLVLPPGACPIVAPRPAHFRTDILTQRVPVFHSTERRTDVGEKESRAARAKQEAPADGPTKSHSGKASRADCRALG